MDPVNPFTSFFEDAYQYLSNAFGPTPANVDSTPVNREPFHSNCEEISRCNSIVRVLEKFKESLLADTPNSDFFIKEFQGFDPEIKTVIGKAIWMACYRPEGNFYFAEDFLRNNARTLLNFKDASGKDLISQVIDHYRSRERLYVHMNEFHSFIKEFTNQHDKDSQIHCFNSLSEYLRNRLAHLVWYRNGGKENPHFGYWGYGIDQILSNPSHVLCSASPSFPSILDLCRDELKKDAQYSLLDGLEHYGQTRYLPSAPLSLSMDKLPQRSVAQASGKKRVLMCSAEVEGAVSTGGLAPAVGGMIRGYGKEWMRLVAPKYDIIDPKISMVEKPKYQIEIHGKIYKVFKAKIDGVRCYFIDSPEHFTIGFNAEKRPNKIYFDSERDLDEKIKWLQFQSLSAEFAFKLTQKARPIEIIHLHDAQMALIPKLMIHRHYFEWKKGQTPATVLSVHNNLCPMQFDYPEAKNALNRVGLGESGLTALVEGIQCSEMVVPVSRQFALEVQTERFGNQMERYTKIAALEGRLIGVPNGDSKGWNPASDPQLQGWVSLLTGKPKDLSYGPEHPELASQLKEIRREGIAYLKHHFKADFDPLKPIFLYVGRFCSGQKGIDLIEVAIKEALKNDVQFICMGTEPDPLANQHLMAIEKLAEERGRQGLVVIRDYRRGDNRLFWQQGNSKEDQSGEPGCGSVIRALTDWAFFGSKFEPFGFVQGEMHRMGKKTLATKVGGFIDTIFTSGPSSNGALFERLEWGSEEQKEAIRGAVREAAKEAVGMVGALYGEDKEALEPYLEQMRTIMRNGLKATWTTTFDGSSSPTDLMSKVYEAAICRLKQRGTTFVDIYPLNIA